MNDNTYNTDANEEEILKNGKSSSAVMKRGLCLGLVIKTPRKASLTSF